jgi:hypothetical protein
MDNTPAPKPLVLIGRLHAHITGDFRYCDEMKVHFDPNTGKVRVRVFTTGAVGGMDSGRSDSYEPKSDFDQTCDANARDVLALIKRAIAVDRFLFKQYGKPTRNFWWVGGSKAYGLSQALVRSVLETARGAATGE